MTSRDHAPDHEGTEAADTVAASRSHASIDATTIAQWYPIDDLALEDGDIRETMLLGHVVRYRRDASGWHATHDGRALPVRAAHGCLWTALAEPAADVPAIGEAAEPDRRLVTCGQIAVAASGLRIVENFLDLAHFPFIHTGILGAEPQTEVQRYAVETRAGGAEIWVTNCRFFQPQAALSATGGLMADYTYRIAGPFCVLLYKTCPTAPDRMDVIALFVQPMTPTTSRAHPVMFLLDTQSPHAALVAFQQRIFLQDRIILENQRPGLMPLDASPEIPTMADRASVAYRRWLRDRGVRYGAQA